LFFLKTSKERLENIDLSMFFKAQKALEKEELNYWKEYSKHKRELLKAEDDYRSLEYRSK